MTAYLALEPRALEHHVTSAHEPTRRAGSPVWAEIDLDAIAGNAARLRAWIGPQCRLLAVVKANGYGHGSIAAAQAALAGGAAGICVGRLDEGLELRCAGITAPVLVLGYVPDWQAETALRFDLTLTVNELALGRALSEAAQRHGRSARVHVKIDTGMTRFGLLPDEAPDFVAELARLPGLELEGLYTHFALADDPSDGYTRRQIELFLATERALARRGLRFHYRHAANSAAILDFPEAHFEAVRAGIALYGIQPGPFNRRLDGLRPALTLKAEVARVREVPPGTAVSYGCTFRTARRSRLALLPAGYGDGLSRALSNRGAALVHGQRAPIVGRVCMDMCVVDVTDIPGVQVGDEAVLIGTQGPECIPVEELAQHAGTLHYEVLTGISARVPRLYFQGGRLVGVQTLNGRAEGV